MTHGHLPAGTTHTVELDQVRAIDAQLGSRAPITAAVLGMDHVAAGAPPAFLSLFESRPERQPELAGRSILRNVRAEGSPEFPYMIGRFEDPVTGEIQVVELHSQALQRLCAAIGLSQCWGTDAVLSGSSIR
jgi:hypothetical protein